jgi:hypothetical protein
MRLCNLVMLFLLIYFQSVGKILATCTHSHSSLGRVRQQLPPLTDSEMPSTLGDQLFWWFNLVVLVRTSSRIHRISSLMAFLLDLLQLSPMENQAVHRLCFAPLCFRTSPKSRLTNTISWMPASCASSPGSSLVVDGVWFIQAIVKPLSIGASLAFVPVLVR